MSIHSAGNVIRFDDADRCERLIWRPEPFTGWFCIDIHSNTAVPIFRSFDELEDLIASGVICETADPWQTPLTEDALTEAQRRRLDQGWRVIRPLVDAQPKCFDKGHRARLSAEIACASAGTISRQSVDRLIRRYWQRGMTPNALLPDYPNSGAPGRSRPVGMAKRGCKVRVGLPGMNIDEGLRERMKDVVTRYFASNRKVDVVAAHQMLLDMYYMDTAVDPATGRQPHPNLGQFRYWLEKDNDTFALER